MVRKPRAPLIAPPDRLRVGPFKEGTFTSRLHSPRSAALLGLALGVSFMICFATGLLSHLIQQPPAWFIWPPRPAGLYRVTQSLHVATGIASIPLLLAKLWTVYPRFWVWPPAKSTMHLVERISLFPLVAGSLFLAFTGIANIGLWYPWRFFFPAGHYWASWITMGALIVHIGAKAGIVKREAFTRDPARLQEYAGEGLSRRGFLGVIAATAGALTITTVGQTFSPLNRLALLAPRRPNVGPQGFPVNKSALSARVTESALMPSYQLRVTGRVERELSLSLDELRSLPQSEATLPISCVEGWSANVSWRGVPLRDLLVMAGSDQGATVSVESLQREGLYRASEVNSSHARDPDTLLALECNGDELHIDHGFPLATDRAEPAGRDADQVGRRVDRPLNDSDRTVPSPRVFWCCAAIGWAVLVYGVAGLMVESDRTHPDQWIRWFAGSLIVHDFVVAPLVIAAGSLLAGRVRAPYRAAVQGALIATGIVALTTWPFLRGYGLRSDNASVLPNNYALGLSVVVVAVWLVAAGVLLRAWRSTR
ncbi:MAG: molybdopterin-dependent oxidoreductase [Actinomycetota bacterium]